MRYPSALAAVLLVVTGSARATEYLQNGSFETGDLTGWTLTDPSGSTFVEPTTFGYGAQRGNYYVYAGPPSSAPGVLSQIFADVAGDSLKVSGWAVGDTFDLPNNLGDVSYYFDGVSLGSPDLSSGKWTESTFQVAATGSDTFSIRFSNDNSFNGLDNFSVANGVPEPSAWILLLIGLFGLGPLAATARRAVIAAVFRSSIAKLALGSGSGSFETEPRIVNRLTLEQAFEGFRCAGRRFFDMRHV
jgi:hypothetical protein